MTRMDERGKFEVSLGALVLLGGATLVASALIFLLGVYVGKGMIESRLAADARVVRLPVPTPGASPKAGDGEVTFWNKLAKGEPAWTPAPTDRAWAPAATPTPQETPVRLPPPHAASPRAGEGAAGKALPTAPPAKAEVKAEAKSGKVEPTTATAEPRTDLASGVFQVQVNAMADKKRADALVQDLQGLGYRVYVSPAKRGSDTLYRVRVAGLASEEAAKQAVSRLREQGYPRAFLVREGG